MFWNHKVQEVPVAIEVETTPQVFISTTSEAQLALLDSREASKQVDRSIAMTRNIREELAYLFDKNHVGQSIEDSFARKLGIKNNELD